MERMFCTSAEAVEPFFAAIFQLNGIRLHRDFTTQSDVGIVTNHPGHIVHTALTFNEEIRHDGIKDVVAKSAVLIGGCPCRASKNSECGQLRETGEVRPRLGLVAERRTYINVRPIARSGYVASCSASTD